MPIQATWQWKKDLRLTDDDEDAWENYDAADCKRLETARSKGSTKMKFSDKYTVNFEEMIQHHTGDKYRQRPIRRLGKAVKKAKKTPAKKTPAKKKAAEAETDTEPPKKKAKKTGKSKIAGKKIVLTGILTMKRTVATAEIIAAGGTVNTDVSGLTDILVAGPGAGSKLQKAQSLGVEIWSEEDLVAAL
eukprot:g9498.t1